MVSWFVAVTMEEKYMQWPTTWPPLKAGSCNSRWKCYDLNYVCVLSHFNHVRLFATPWTVAHQAPLSVGFSRQEYWSGLPCIPPSPGDLPTQGSNLHLLCLLHWQVGSLPLGPPRKSSVQQSTVILQDPSVFFTDQIGELKGDVIEITSPMTLTI